MKNIFTCPHCEAVLNPSVKILLVIGYRKKKGMILLSPQPGNYKYICDRLGREASLPMAPKSISPARSAPKT